MSTDLARPVTELASRVIVPLARFVGKLGYDLFCYHKVIKELERVERRLKGVHDVIQGKVNKGLVDNEGHLPVWLPEAENLLKELREIKLDSKVESDSKLFLMMCLCSRCCNCGEAQRKIEAAIALITDARKFHLRLVSPASHAMAIIEDVLKIPISSTMYMGIIL